MITFPSNLSISVTQNEFNSKCVYFQIDLGAIKAAYNVKYGKPLVEAITSECGGDFRNVLMAIAQ